MSSWPLLSLNGRWHQDGLVFVSTSQLLSASDTLSSAGWLSLSLSFCCHASGTRHNVISSATTQPTSPLTKSAADDGKCTLITTRPRSTTRKMRTSLPLSLSFALSLRQISCRVLWCIIIVTMILQSKVLHPIRLKTRKLGQSLLILVMSPS